MTPGPGAYEKPDQFDIPKIKVKKGGSRNADLNFINESNPVLVSNSSGSLKRHTTIDSDTLGESKFENEIV